VLRGRFGDTTGRPYLEGRLVIPRFAIDANISFLVDTGADSSLIAPADGYEMGLDYALFGTITESIGAGGIAQSYTEMASIAFTDPGKEIYVYHVSALEFAVPRRDIEEMPSLLGREVLDRWRMVYDPTKPELSFIVRSADLILPVS
jgi:hypothetical protein